MTQLQCHSLRITLWSEEPIMTQMLRKSSNPKQMRRMPPTHGGTIVHTRRRRCRCRLCHSNSQRRPGCGGGKFWPTNLPGILVRKEADRGDASWKKGPQRRRKEANLVNHFTELANFITTELKLDLEQARLRETCLG